MAHLVEDPTWATQFSITGPVERAGTQGVELLMWLAARGTPQGGARRVHGNYHIPNPTTAAGLLVLEPAAS